MGRLNTTTIAIDDLQDGSKIELLTDADVVIAVDAVTREEDVVYGHPIAERADRAEFKPGITVIRVELDMESDDLDWLAEAIDQGPVEPGAESDDEEELDV
jgi:hypothetical protein